MPRRPTATRVWRVAIGERLMQSSSDDRLVVNTRWSQTKSIAHVHSVRHSEDSLKNTCSVFVSHVERKPSTEAVKNMPVSNGYHCTELMHDRENELEDWWILKFDISGTDPFPVTARSVEEDSRSRMEIEPLKQPQRTLENKKSLIKIIIARYRL